MAAASDTEVVAAAAHVYRETSRGFYNGLQAHLNDPRLSDLVLVRPDGRSIHVHQVILSACSRKFATVLAHGDVTGKELPIQGVDSAALESVVGFFYRGECLLTPATVVPIYDVCLKLEVPGLSAGCEQYMQQSLNPQTCSIFLGAAVELLLEQTMKMCLDYAKSRFDDVVAAPSFQSLGNEAVRLLLTYCRGSVGEMGLARALARWAVRRPEQLAECEALFQELNITATVLLQLLQSPDFVAGLQAQQQRQRQQQSMAAERVAPGAAAVASMAATALPGAGGGSGASGATAAAAARAAGSAGTAGSLGGGLGPGPGSALPHREVVPPPPPARLGSADALSQQQQQPLAMVGHHLPGSSNRQLQQLLLPAGPAPAAAGGGAPSPGSSSAGGGRVEGPSGVLGFGGDRDRDSSDGRPPPRSSSLSKGERWASAVDGGGGGVGRESAAARGTVEAGAGACSRAAQQHQQQQQHVLQGRPPGLGLVSTGDEGAATSAQRVSDTGYLLLPPPPPQDASRAAGGGGGEGGGGAASSARDDDGPPRMRRPAAAAAVAAAAPATTTAANGRSPFCLPMIGTAAADGETGRQPLHLANVGLGLGMEPGDAAADDADAASPVSGDSAGSAGGGEQALFAVPLAALEGAGLSLHLLPSGDLAASGGVLGSRLRPLQVASAGGGSNAPLLALLPRALLMQLQQAAATITTISGAAEQPPAQHFQRQQQQQEWRQQRAQASQQQQTRGSGRAGGGGGVSRLPLLLEAAADDSSVSVGGGGGGGGRGQPGLRREPDAEVLDLRVTDPAGGGSGGLALPSRFASTGRSITSIPASGLSAGSGGGFLAASAQRGGSGGGSGAIGLGVYSAATAVGAPLAAASPHRGGRGTAAAALGGGSGVRGAGEGSRSALPLLPPPYGSAELGGLVSPQRWPSPGRGGDDFSGGTATAAIAAQLAAVRTGGIRPTAGMQPQAPREEDSAAAGGGGGGSGGGGKRRRGSPEEDDPDHLEEGGGGGSSSRAGGGGGWGRGSRSGFGGRAAGDVAPGAAPGSKLPLMCHVDDCHVDLTSLKEYHQRFRICDFHLKAETVMRDGIPQRFCQQCGRFHVLAEFDGTKRSCRARLQRHNARRRKRPEQRGSGGDGGSDEPRKPRRSPPYAAAAQHRDNAPPPPPPPPLHQTPPQLAALRDAAVAAAGLVAAARGDLMPAAAAAAHLAPLDGDWGHFLQQQQLQHPQQQLEQLLLPPRQESMALPSPAAVSGLPFLDRPSSHQLLDERAVAAAGAGALLTQQLLLTDGGGPEATQQRQQPQQQEQQQQQQEQLVLGFGSRMKEEPVEAREHRRRESQVARHVEASEEPQARLWGGAGVPRAQQSARTAAQARLSAGGGPGCGAVLRGTTDAAAPVERGEAQGVGCGGVPGSSDAAEQRYADAARDGGEAVEQVAPGQAAGTATSEADKAAAATAAAAAGYDGSCGSNVETRTQSRTKPQCGGST